MKTLKFESATIPDYFNKEYVKHLNDLGFKLTHFASAIDDEEFHGLHTLIFEHDGKTVYREHWVRTICTGPDMDGQPHPNYSLYLNTLYLFIPYTT